MALGQHGTRWTNFGSAAPYEAAGRRFIAMKICSHCGLTRQPDFRFCPGCGADLAVAAAGQGWRATGPAAPPVRTPGAGLLVEENKHLTVMFVDLCGSTEYVARATPEDARQFLRRVIALMKEVIEGARFEGYVSQVRGDGVLALFGAPLALEDHALRACRAAIELQRRFGTLDRALRIRIGIDSGTVVVGPDELGVLQADGLPVHRASRLEQLALPGKVLLSGDCHRLTAGAVDATPLGWRSIRGLPQTELFELSLAEGQASAAAWARGRYFSRALVGRAELLATLERATRDVGGLRVVALRGEAGIGKSRLLMEFGTRVQSGFSGRHEIVVPPDAAHWPFWLAAALARSLIDPTGQQDDLALRRTVAGWREPLSGDTLGLLDLLDIGAAGSPWRTLTPAQRVQRSGDALLALIDARLADGPLLVVVEDLFRADHSSLHLLDGLLHRLRHAPLVLLTTYRLDFTPPWAAAAWFTEHAVERLRPAEAQQLAHQILGSDESIGALADRLVAKAEGNPLYLEQIVFSLANDGTLTGAPGAYRCGRALADLAVPPSIGALIDARVDRLPTDTKETLQAAAVLGQTVTADLVAAMRNVSVESVDDDLNVAVDAGLLTAPPRGAAARFGFRHALVQEAVRDALTQPRRRMLHAAAFCALRDQLGGQADDHAVVLADHAVRGQLWQEAAEFALRSIARAVARSANREALRMYEVGLEATQRLGADPTRLALELGLRLEALGALLPLGQMDRIVATLERASALTRELGDRRREAAVLVQLAVALWAGGRYGQGLAMIEQALGAALRADSRSLQMAAVQARMMLSHGLGRYADVVQDAQRVKQEFAAELSARKLLPGWAVIAVVNVEVFLADALRRTGRAAEAQAACALAYRQLAEQDHPFSRVLVDFAQAALWLDADRAHDAVRTLEAAARSCEIDDVPTMAPAIIAELGGALARAGRASEALTLLDEAIGRRMELIGGRYNDFYLPLNHARALAAAGYERQALAAARRAVAAAAHHDQRGHQAEAQLLLAERLLAAGGPLEEAQRALAAAQQLAADCAMAPLAQRAGQRLAHLRDGAGTTLAAAGPGHA